MNIVVHGSKEKISKFNIIRKFLIFVIFALMATPAFATPNWVQIDNKKYIDTNSLRKENYNNYYSVWWKLLNDDSKFFFNSENYYKTKIWYEMQQLYFDCENKRYALKSNIVDSKTYNDYNLSFTNIPPGSFADFMYGNICTGEF